MTQPPGVIAGIIDGAAALWWRRRAALRAPHIDLAELGRIDEQMEAHLASLRIAARRNGAGILDDEAEDDEAIAFLRGILAMDAPAPEFRLAAIGERLASSSPTPVIAALALAEKSAVQPILGSLLGASDPAARAVAIAAHGARRTNLDDETLERLATDPDPRPRARAFRAIGQLGRPALIPHLISAGGDDDPECRYWAAWSAARLGASGGLTVLTDIADGEGPRTDDALAMLMRCMTADQGKAWLGGFARRHPDRRRSLVRATGIIGDPLYVPWLLGCMEEPDIARLAGEAFTTITGLDISQLDMDRDPPAGVETGPNDDPADEGVELDEDEWLPWPAPDRIGAWWGSHGRNLPAGTAFFLGRPKDRADWLGALGRAFQRQRLAAAIELGLRQPDKPMFEARARGRLQQRMLERAGLSSGGSSGPS